MRDGLLISEVDLNLISQIRDKWCFQVLLLPYIRIYNTYTQKLLYTYRHAIYGVCLIVSLWQMTMRLDMYAEEFSEAVRPDFKPQAVYEPVD